MVVIITIKQNISKHKYEKKFENNNYKTVLRYPNYTLPQHIYRPFISCRLLSEAFGRFKVENLRLIKTPRKLNYEPTKRAHKFQRPSPV
jgi:hypothetical protein